MSPTMHCTDAGQEVTTDSTDFAEQGYNGLPRTQRTRGKKQSVESVESVVAPRAGCSVGDLYLLAERFGALQAVRVRGGATQELGRAPGRELLGLGVVGGLLEASILTA